MLTYEFIITGVSESEPVTTWVVLGGEAALPCDIQPEDPLEQLATVLWYKGNQGEPIYTWVTCYCITQFVPQTFVILYCNHRFVTYT